MPDHTRLHYFSDGPLGALPAARKNQLLEHVYSTLEMRVGSVLGDQMTSEQFDEFEALVRANDDAGALTWMETNFPHYKDIVAEQFGVLTEEIRAVADRILAAEGLPAGGDEPAAS